MGEIKRFGEEDRTRLFVSRFTNAIAISKLVRSGMIFDATDYENQKQIVKDLVTRLSSEEGKSLDQGKIPEDKMINFLEEALSKPWNAETTQLIYADFLKLQEEKSTS